MNQQQQEKIYELLKRGLKLIESGEDMPAEWAREIFPSERREYELIYYGKDSEEKIIADAMAVPFQEASKFSTNGNSWHNMLIFGDNLQAMKTLLQLKENGTLVNADGTPGVRLIYIDPPFATKREFRGTQDQKAYQDKLAGARFIEFLRKRLVLIRNLLSEDGSVYVHLDYKKSHYVKVILDEIFGEQSFRGEIVWKRTDAHNDTKGIGRIHDIIFIYSRSEKTVWNPIYIPLSEKTTNTWYKHVEEGTGRRYNKADLTARGIRRGETGNAWKGINPTDKGNHWRYPPSKLDNLLDQGLVVFSKSGMPYLKRYLDESKGTTLQDIWTDVPMIRGFGGEGVGYPTQKPEALIERIIKSSSNTGDVVLDAFAGAGTAAAVAEKLGRRWVGIDCGKFAVYTFQKRMMNLRKGIGNKGQKIKPKPFTLYNAGLYDFSRLRDLSWEDWRFFALQLFECKDELHKIHGFQMDGKRRGSSVHVFNHFNEGTVSRETIADLHASIGKAIGDRCFIIAPRGAFLFQEDYIEMDDVRYYALRIPYSFINELHRREFSALVQPNDEMAINETVEAVGFDFIQPPLVELQLIPNKQDVSVKIKEFESRARLRGEEKVTKHDALSMVMVDYDYNGKVFDLDKSFYANEIKDNKWKIELPIKKIKGNLMLVFLDIYGNEARIVIEKSKTTSKALRAKGKK